jgi:NitT/TauT family transport system substrate-binding protein
MPFPSRRAACAGLAALGGRALLPSPAAAAPPNLLDSLTIHGMPSIPSVVLAHMVQDPVLATLVRTPVLAIYRNADQMRTGVLAGSMKVFGTPSYSAANMFNREVPIRQINILTWGLVYVMSRDPAIRRIEDLAGRHVLVPSRNDAPDLIFRLVLRRLGMNPDQDLRLQYVGTPTEAAQLFLAGQADCALTPEPAGTAVEMRAFQAGIAVTRAIDLTDAYAAATGRPARISQAGLGVTEDFVQAHPEVVAAIHAGCVASARWVLDHPAEAGRLGATHLGLAAEIVERSIPRFRLAVASAAEARADMEHYFADLMEMSPGIVGGKLPEPRFYWGTAG